MNAPRRSSTANHVSGHPRHTKAWYLLASPIVALGLFNMAKKHRPRKPNKDQRTGKVTWAQMARDVLVRSMDRGQGPLYLCGFVIVAIIVKMPPKEVATLATKIVDKLLAGWLLGYILAAALAIAWPIHARRMRWIFFKEQDRMGKEKARLQEKLIGGSMKSSRDLEGK